MGSRDPRVDEYIASAPDFARPILIELRELAHEVVPEITETIKWGVPSLEYKGSFFGIAKFKAHCRAVFWLTEQLREQDDAVVNANLNRLGDQITSLDDLPPREEIVDILIRSKALKDAGAKLKRTTEKKPDLPTPGDLAAALREHDIAERNWENFTPAMRRDYIEWISEAKTDATRQKRIDTTVEWVGEGKRRNWKYEKC